MSIHSLGVLPPSSSLWSAYASEVLLPSKEGEMESKIYPYTQEVLWKRSEKKHHLSDPVSLSFSLPTLLPLTEEGIQTEEESGYKESG